MEIKGEPQTVEVLFSPSEQQYRIPIYQRRYVWDQKNWDKLWIDVQDKPSNKGLFTGIIVTRLPEDPGDLEIYDVIDGQQRLTTFQIILCVIRDICWKIGHTSKGNEANELIQVDGRHKLCLKEGPDKEGSDDKAFRALVDSGTRHDHIIHEAYEHFNDLIEGYTPKELDDLYIAITQGINVAQINLIEDDMSEKIFASLNATGRMLNEFDYLRNDLFLRAKDQAADFYESPAHWHPSFEKDTPSYLDDFLYDFLKANLGADCFDEPDIKPFELYQGDYSNKLLKSGDIEDEFRQLSTYAGVYEDMNNPNSELGRHRQFYKDLNLKILPLDSFLLFVKQKVGLSSTDLPEIYEILESYIIRNILVDWECYGDRYKMISNYFSDVIEGKRPPFSVPGFISFLSATCPDDTQVKDCFNHVWDTLIFRYIFYRIELKLQKGKGATSPLSFKDLKTLVLIATMDDLVRGMPWPTDPIESKELITTINKASYNIGNATVLVQPSPRDWPTRSISEKQKALKTLAPDLVLTDHICAAPGWGVTRIGGRTTDLTSCFFDIWPEL